MFRSLPRLNASPRYIKIYFDACRFLKKTYLKNELNFSRLCTKTFSIRALEVFFVFFFFHERKEIICETDFSWTYTNMAPDGMHPGVQYEVD